MKVLQVNKFLYRRGGAEAYMLDLAEALRGRGHGVELWGMHHPQNPPLRFEHSFVSETDFESPPAAPRERALMAGRLLYSPGARHRIRKVLRSWPADVVHADNVYHQLSPSVLAGAGAAGAAVVMTLHDYKLSCPVYRFLNADGICEACGTGQWYEATRRRCTRGMLGPSALNTVEAYLHHGLGLYTRHVDLFISPSRFLADRAIRVGVPADKVVVEPNFTDLDRVEPVYGGEDVVFAGRLSPEKGVATLVDAVGALDGVRLQVYGTGPSEDDLAAQAEAVAPGRVVFHGRQSAGTVAAAMAGAAAVAVPSEWHENCPLVVLEAMAAGTPVVTTELGGLPELVDDGVDGVVVPYGDAGALAKGLASVTGDDSASAELGRNARAKAEARFDRDVHVSRIEDHYSRIMG